MKYIRLKILVAALLSKRIVHREEFEMPEITREELVEQLAQMAGVSAEEAEIYLKAGDEYVDGLPAEIKEVDGDDQLEYIYENTDLGYPAGILGNSITEMKA